MAGAVEVEGGVVVGRCGVDFGGAEGGEGQGYLIEGERVTVGGFEGQGI